MALRDFDEADRLYDRSQAILKKEGTNPLSQGWHCYHKGTVQFFKGRALPAEKWFKKSFTHFKKIKDPLGQVASLTHLGETALEKGKLKAAENYFVQALDLALPIRLIPHLVDLLVALAQLLKARNDERSALVFLVAALNHPTCRRQTKDRIVQFATRLEARFSTDEVQDAVQQAKASRVEELAQNLAGGRAPRALKPSRRKKPAKFKK